MEKARNAQKQLRILVGDDQVGVAGSLPQKSFLRYYKHLAEFDFENNAENFILRAKEGKYDALIIDLNWEEADWSRDYKTGFRVLKAVKDYAPIRILHTSDEQLMKRGFEYGATDCLEKNRSASFLEQALNKKGQVILS